MRGRLVGAICSLCAGCVLDATGADPGRGGSGDTVSASSSGGGDTASTATASTGSGSACGDGALGPFEPCDDGGQVSGDGCSATCNIEEGYLCRGMPSVCTICGDGLVLKGETCEDGNLRTGDGCDGCNASHTCGNGNVEPTEACDQSGAASPCTDTCTFGANSECATAVDLSMFLDPVGRRGRYDGNTIGSPDTTFPQHLYNAPNNQGSGSCVEPSKPSGVPVVKHRYVTGAYPSMLEASVTYDVVAPDANTDPVAWAYRGCDVSTLDVVCNDDSSIANQEPLLQTPPLPPVSTVVIAVSGYLANNVGSYSLRYREVELPWQEDFTALPLAAELATAPGLSRFCHDDCGVMEVCSPVACPDGHFLQIDDPAGPSQAIYLTSPPIAARGQGHVELELRHASNVAADATVTVFVSTDRVAFQPVKTFNGPFARRELIDLFPAPMTPSPIFYVRVTFQGSATPVVGSYALGLMRVRLYDDYVP